MMSVGLCSLVFRIMRFIFTVIIKQVRIVRIFGNPANFMGRPIFGDCKNVMGVIGPLVFCTCLLWTK
jgi:hypothetical protein